MTTATRYADLADVKARLNIPDTDTAEDATLDALTVAASRAIDDLTRRQFFTVSETRYFSAPAVHPIHPFSQRLGGGGAARVEVDDLLSVTTLATDLDGDGIYESVWAAGTDYYLWPANAPSWQQPYTHIERNPVQGRYPFPALPRGVQVTAVWGYAASVPAPVQEACLLWVGRLYKRRDAPLGIVESLTATAGGVGGSIMRVTADADIRALLERYRREWVVL